MSCFTTPLHEANDCHEPAGQPTGGQFCSKGGGGDRRSRLGRGAGKGPGYQLLFPSALDKTGSHYSPRYMYSYVEDHVPSELLRKARRAKVVLKPDIFNAGDIGAPLVWKAPNGVYVIYARGQRRNEEKGRGTYHDFNPEEETVIPATRNIGSGRRALRAWANEFLQNRVSLRFRARQLVRSGD